MIDGYIDEDAPAKPERGQLLIFDHRIYRRKKAEERARERRWNAYVWARVDHPKYGSVVVPHCSNLAAVFNAAEYWGCDWTEIIDAKVWWAQPEDGPAVRMPERFCV